MRLLLEKVEDPNAVSEDNETPADIVEMYTSVIGPELIELLEEYRTKQK